MQKRNGNNAPRITAQYSEVHQDAYEKCKSSSRPREWMEINGVKKLLANLADAFDYRWFNFSMNVSTFRPRPSSAFRSQESGREWACAFQENRMQIMTFPVRRNYQFTLRWQLVEKLCGNDNFGFASNCLCAKALLTTKVSSQILLQDKRMKCVLMDSCEIVCGSSEKRICQQLYEKLCGAFCLMLVFKLFKCVSVSGVVQKNWRMEKSHRNF